MSRFHIAVLTTPLAALLSVASPALAQDAEVGELLFQRHCATCHGLEARGDGPMSGVMVIKPTNLTELAIGNDGNFPLERVVKRIDGRDPLVSHGSPMPVYGDYFEGVQDIPVKAPTGQPLLASQPVVDILAFLTNVQRVE